MYQTHSDPVQGVTLLKEYNVSLPSIQFEDQDILKITHSLNYSKAHGYDDIS